MGHGQVRTRGHRLHQRLDVSGQEDQTKQGLKIHIQGQYMFFVIEKFKKRHEVIK